MPLWGRPSGGRMGRKSQRGAEGRSWERRFEEVEDSDEDDGQGVELDLRAPRKRYASDELRFTGIDLSTLGPRRRKPPVYEESDYSDEEGEDEDEDEDDGHAGRGQNMQIMLREKEDFLVQQATDRIRRAQKLGKTNVRLSQAEAVALERAERIQKQTDPLHMAKGKKATGRPMPRERRRSKNDKPPSITPPLKAMETRKRAKKSVREEPQPPYPTMPGTDHGQTSGAMVYAPTGYYAPPAQRPIASTTRSRSRTASSQSLRQHHQHQQHAPPLPQYQHPYHSGRYFSNPDSVYAARPPPDPSFRHDPSHPNWEPRARSTSNLGYYPVEQPPYPVYQPPLPSFDPRDPRFAVPPGSHLASGPPNMYPLAHIPSYRHPQQEPFLYSPSTPDGRSDLGDDDGEDSDDDDYDDDDQGSEIDVVEQSSGSYGVQTRSSTAAAAGNRDRGGGAVDKRGTRGK